MDGRSDERRLMPKVMTRVFDRRAKEYDGWFDDHPAIYLSELAALRKVALKGGLEIGVGTGRFALPLRISIGLDPSLPMLAIARERGLEVVRGMAEELPFGDGTFDQALFVTTLCFISDPLRAMNEARRIVRQDGRLVIGLLDFGSAIGRRYLEGVKDSSFYRGARFLSTAQVLGVLRKSGWSPSAIFQTIFVDPKEMTVPDPVLPGHGRGLFVAMSAVREGTINEGKNATICADSGDAPGHCGYER